METLQEITGRAREEVQSSSAWLDDEHSNHPLHEPPRVTPRPIIGDDEDAVARRLGWWGFAGAVVGCALGGHFSGMVLGIFAAAAGFSLAVVGAALLCAAKDRVHRGPPQPQ